MALSLRKLPYCIIANKAVDKYVRMERGRYAALLSEIKRSGLQFATASELNPVMYAASAAAARSTTDKPLQLASEHLSTRQKNYTICHFRRGRRRRRRRQLRYKEDDARRRGARRAMGDGRTEAVPA